VRRLLANRVGALPKDQSTERLLRAADWRRSACDFLLSALSTCEFRRLFLFAECPPARDHTMNHASVLL